MMSPTNPGLIVAKNSNINQKMVLSEIVGVVVFVLLVLLCLLFHYFRRKCSKPRQLFKKLQLPSTLRGAKKDQSTSMSYLSLVVSRSESEYSNGNRQPESFGHNEVVMADVHANEEGAEGEADLHTPVLQHTYNVVVMVDVHANEEGAEGQADLHTPVLQHTYNEVVMVDVHANEEGAEGQADLHTPVLQHTYNEVVMVDVHANEGAEGEADLHTPVLQHTYNEVVMVDVHANEEGAEGEADLHTPVLQHTYSTSQEFSPREESLFHKENDLSHMSLENMTSFLNSVKSLEKTEGYGSPDKEDNRHSFSSRSLFEKEGQAKFQVELSSPHSQQQMQPQHLAAQAISQQHLQESGTGDWKSQHVVMSESVSIPASLSEELLTKKGLTEVRRGNSLPHPQAWFVSLDGHSNTVRHSYTDLQTDGRNGINNFSLDYGNDGNELKQKGQMYSQKDLDEVDQSGSECGTAVCSPEDNTPRCVLEEGRRRTSGQLPSLQEGKIKRSVERPSKPSPSTEHKITGHHKADCDGYDNNDDQREDKKTPWEKREERPVLMFNLK